ncbi:MAG TPA: TIGR01777 family oxidoreductase, partial [Agitococcus sp.]|nr:TIGR01777 family oxidoreductase [Agitococcus sp.]
WTNKRKQALYDSRVSLTKDLVNWLKQCSHQPQLLISGSAIGWYGNQHDNKVDETSAPHQEFVHELCHEWEQAALTMQSSSTRVCIIRTGVVLGSQGGMLKRLLPIFKLNLGGRLGNGQQWFSWIGLDDFIAAILFLIHHPQVDGIFNLTAPNPVTNQQFTQIFAQHLHRIAPFPVPSIVLKLLLGEMSTLLLDGQQVIPQRLINLDFDFKSPTLDQALLNNA